MAATYLAYIYNLGRPTETSEPCLMSTCISCFTALRKIIISYCAYVSFPVTSRIEASYLAYAYICGRQTEISEPYLKLTYILWFTALGKNVHLLRLHQFLSNYKGWRLHFWHSFTSWKDQKKAMNWIWIGPIFHGSLHLENMFSFCALVSFSVTTGDWGFIFGIQVHLWKTNRKWLTVSDVDLYLMVHCT